MFPLGMALLLTPLLEFPVSTDLGPAAQFLNQFEPTRAGVTSSRSFSPVMLAAHKAPPGTTDWIAILKEGDRRKEAKDINGAIAAYQQLISVARGHGMEIHARYSLGFIYLEEKGQFEEALRQFEEIIKLLDDSLIKSREIPFYFKSDPQLPLRMALTGKARAYEAMGEFEKALDAFQGIARTGLNVAEHIARMKAVIAKRKEGMQTIELSLQKAMEAEKQGQHREAIKHYMAALAAEETVNPTNIHRGIVERVITLARTLDPPPAVPEEARRQAVYAHTALKEAKDASGFNQAIREYFRAIRLAPWWGDLYLNTALLLEQTGHFSVAITSLQFFLVASPNDPDTEKVKNKIYELEYKAKAEKR